MTHVITSKVSHERTPRMVRDAKFHWAPGAPKEFHKLSTTNKTDRWGLAMIAVAVAGSLAVVVKFIFS